MDSVWLATLIFIGCYALIMMEKLNRALIAGAGGVLMLFFGIYDLNSAFVKHIDWSTIALLFSMMILVSVSSKTGIFEYVAIHVAQMVQGKPIPLLFVLSLLTAIGSALLDNVTTVLLFVPILLTLTEMLKVPAMPYLISVILASNIGGTATLIGDPPNIMIGQAVEHLTFNDFLFNLSPVVLIVFSIVVVGLALLYRKQLHIPESNRRILMEMNPSSFLVKSPMLYQSIAVLLMTICGFVLHPVIHADITSVAMAGALLILLLTHKEYKTEEAFKNVEWVTLFFFMGLFMLVGGLEEVGIIDKVARSIFDYTEGDIQKTALFILWVSGILSGFVDNIPFVAAMIPVIQEFEQFGFSDLDPLWWSLALGACLGGNGTLIGASANVVVAGLAARANQTIRFMEFIKIGIPVVLASLIISSLYIYLRYFVQIV